MAEKIQELKEYCQAYCERHQSGATARNVVPVMMRMTFGGIVFGFYCSTYNRARAGSIVLRKSSVHPSERDVLRVLEDRRVETSSLESNRVVVDHIACWEAIEKIPPGIADLVSQLERETQYFKREQGTTRNLKPRIEQDVRNYNAVHYSNRVLVPMIFELGRAGVVFGFYNTDDSDTANRGNTNSLLLEQATSLGSKDELWEVIDRGYDSRQHICIALDQISCYYSLMDMQELADNIRAKELIARLKLKPTPVESELPEYPDRPSEEQEEGYLKLWGWEIKVSKQVLPEVFTQDVDVSGIADNVGRVLKSDVGVSAKKLLNTELKIPFTANNG